MDQETFDTFTDMLKQAEDTFRKGSASLSDWSEQARDILQNKPGVLIAAVAISGFMTGALIRQAVSGRGRAAERFPADPFLTFIAGAAAGVLLGQRILSEALGELGMGAESAGGEKPGEPNPLLQKPFERSYEGSG